MKLTQHLELESREDLELLRRVVQHYYHLEYRQHMGPQRKKDCETLLPLLKNIMERLQQA